MKTILATWQTHPAGSTWDPAVACSRRRDPDGGKFAPLSQLLSSLRQGVDLARVRQGDVSVRAIRVADIYPLLLGDGAAGMLNADVVRRHLAEDGDVFIARVGRLGQVGCVTHATESLLPGSGVIVGRPLTKNWGPVIAAALSTNYIRGLLGESLIAGQRPTLTIEQLRELPVPSPRHFNFPSVWQTVDAAGRLIREASEILNRVRGRLQLLLEGAPTDPWRRLFTWISDRAWPQAWGWTDVQRHVLTTGWRSRATSLVRLGEVVDLDAARPSTVDAAGDARRLESDDIRPDWYLAIPDSHSQGRVDKFDHTAIRHAPKRFFEVDRESLLIPTVGDIAGSPVVLPAESVGPGRVPVMVPIYWLPLAGLAWPRVLAVVLDHPFVRLQRKLAGAFSTVTHITRESLAELLIPAINDETRHNWEAELRRAQRLFIEALAEAREAIGTVERWYA